MSTAHRPTWNPAAGKEVKSGSRQFSTRDVASHTKLKFRQPGQGGTSEIQKRDLRLELLKAEEEARAKKRKAGGFVGNTEDEEGEKMAIEDRSAEEVKRRKILQDIVLDEDKDSEDEEEEEEDEKGKGKGKQVAMQTSDDDEDEDESDEDDEDETAELLRELEKIKRERAEEQARKEREAQAANAAAREEEIATANPLMNLQAALGQGATSSASGSFAVKKRWDDDLIFKNQANGASDQPSGQFVNDLLRTEFHRKFMSKFIK
ncbi:Cwf15/Cwc15 cell cycle control protein [Serendipita vermifera]|nr:Cwf15/Cwc15 cell cycle control protein [Serendipita vermifera]